MMRASLGAGIGIKTPLGVIRFNYAVPVLKADFDKEEKFSFQLGTGF
jgi:outer membrane protein insertion porin family